jgi:hypothetical protein
MWSIGETVKYARIDLAKTDYTQINNWSYINHPDIKVLNNIYLQYCRYKQFKSVMPIFDSQYLDVNTDILGYYDSDQQLIAFSLIRKYDQHNAECAQFAWDYKQPELRLGIETMKHECALYKALGYKYLYLGGADEYKREIAGFEMLGPA